MNKIPRLVLIAIGAVAGSGLAVVIYQVGGSGALIVGVAAALGCALVVGALRPKQKCVTCGGLGRLGDYECPTCHKTGYKL